MGLPNPHDGTRSGRKTPGAYPYRISIGKMWQVIPLEDPAPQPLDRYEIGPWSDQGWGTYRGPAILRRKFGAPGQLGPGELLHLVIGGCDGYAEVLLNGQQLLGEHPPYSIARHDITRLIQRRNLLEIRIRRPWRGPTAGVHGGILWGTELQICPHAWIESASAVVVRAGDNKVRVVGAVKVASLLHDEHARVEVELRDRQGILTRRSLDCALVPGERTLNLEIEAELERDPAATGYRSLLWIVNERLATPSEPLTVTCRLVLSSGETWGLDLPAGVLSPVDVGRADRVRRLEDISLRPELALEEENSPVAVQVPPALFHRATLSAVVARVGGHPRLSAWICPPPERKGAAATTEELRLLDPVRPVIVSDAGAAATD